MWAKTVLAFLPDNFFSLVCDLAPCEGKEGRLVVRQEDDDGEREGGIQRGVNVEIRG